MVTSEIVDYKLYTFLLGEVTYSHTAILLYLLKKIHIKSIKQDIVSSKAYY